MKKILLLFIVALTVFLVACDPSSTTDGPVGCVPGYEAIDGVCTKIEVDDPVDPIDPINSDLTGPDYQDQGYDAYEGRDIVSTSCDHLANIGEWQPVWCDEFSSTGLPDSSLWSYDVGGNGWGNGEEQYYTNADSDNVFVQEGILTIKAIKEFTGSNEYTSTRLISKNKGDFLYGKIQVRAKVPSGRGVWPAIWMLPTDWEYGGWPTSGEIDIMEYVGYQPNVLHATIHTGAYNHSLNTQIGKTRSVNTIEEEFHVFEIEWEPNVIRYYIDGIKFFTVSYDPDDSYTVEPHEAWPFDKDFHLLINTAIGGAWGGAQGIDDSIFPQSFEIDYVRVYQKDYVTMDSEAPSAITNGRTLKVTQSEAFIAWDIALDDVMTEEYQISMNGTLIDTVTHNGFHIEGLMSETTYTFSVVPVDFAGNVGVSTDIIVETDAPLTVNDRIEAEDYISMSGIQVESTSDTGGGENIGYIDQNDYMEYTMFVTEAGNYTMTSRIASPSGASFDLVDNSGTVVVSQNVSATGGWQSWSSVTSGSFYLPAGSYTFKIVATGTGFNINYYEFDKVN